MKVCARHRQLRGAQRRAHHRRLRGMRAAIARWRGNAS